MKHRLYSRYIRELQIAFNIVFLCLFGAIVLAFRSVSLGVVCLLLILFLSSNLLFHKRAAKLSTETLLEYILVGILVFLLTYSAFNR